MPINSKQNEIWRGVVGYEGKYEVSNFGNIRNIKKIEKELATYVNEHGYAVIGLYNTKEHKCIHYRVHRLVATAFIPNPNNKKTVNHIDGNKLNNDIGNLEWATHSENVRHAFDTGIRKVTGKQRENARVVGAKNLCNHLRRVRSIDSSGNIVCYDSVDMASKAVGRSKSAITNCCRGKSASCAGLNWEYLDENRQSRKRQAIRA